MEEYAETWYPGSQVVGSGSLFCPEHESYYVQEAEMMALVGHGKT